MSMVVKSSKKKDSCVETHVTACWFKFQNNLNCNCRCALDDAFSNRDNSLKYVGLQKSCWGGKNFLHVTVLPNCETVHARFTRSLTWPCQPTTWPCHRVVSLIRDKRIRGTIRGRWYSRVCDVRIPSERGT